MKIKLHFNEVSERRDLFIPFELILNEDTYPGTFEVITMVNEYFPYRDEEYKIHWDDKEPKNVDETN